MKHSASIELLLPLSRAMTNQLSSDDSAALQIYLITDEHMDSCWPLLVDLADLARGNAEELSNFLRQFNSCQFFQVDGMVHCKRERTAAVSTVYLLLEVVCSPETPTFLKDSVNPEFKSCHTHLLACDLG